MLISSISTSIADFSELLQTRLAADSAATKAQRLQYLVCLNNVETTAEFADKLKSDLSVRISVGFNVSARSYLRAVRYPHHIC